MKRSFLSALTALAGLVVVGVAIFATQIGIDHNTNWGKGRILVFILGSIVILGSLVLFIIPEKFLASIRSSTTTQRNNLSERLRKNPITGFFAESKPRQMYLFAILAVLFSSIVYTWYVSVGRWTDWPPTTNDYDQLATSFQHGKLWLEEQPSPALLALPDPYDYTARKNANVAFPWDISLYQGKFTNYEGAMPAIILAAIKIVFPVSIGDQVLTFGFLAGMLIFNALLIIKLWQRFFLDTPKSLILMCILVADLVCPLPWMLGRAAVYEATITGGQFFLMGGLYFAYSALEKQSISNPKLLLAITLWACAALSRTIVIIPAAFLTFMVFVWIVKDSKRIEEIFKSIPKLIILGLPLVLGLTVQAWYDWARFGSILETGLHYSLTFINLNDSHTQAFSASYFLQNLWMYLFNLFQTRHVFPFIFPKVGHAPSLLDNASHHHTEEITGLIFSAPFALFAVVPAWNSVHLLSQNYLRKHATIRNSENELLLWLSLSLIGASFLSFAAILFYFNMTMRFLAEFIPSLVILSSLGVWQGYYFLRHKSIARRLYIFCSISLGIISIMISLLLAMTGYYNTFQQLNPHLFKLIIQFFNHF
jgi:hypothetical protein